jgi:ferrochelatase
MSDYDAVLLLSFGGPEGPDDVMPFLRNVVRGKNVPDERLFEVRDRYLQVGGVSPIVAETEALLSALREALPERRIYLGNRNWRPFLADTLEEMAKDGVARAIAFTTSAYSSYSSCRQYLEDIETARAKVGARAPVVDKIPPFYAHPGFIEANRERLRDALARAGSVTPTVLFTAHSLPTSMAAGCDYEAQLEKTGQAILAGLEPALESRLVYQSRSGPPSVPWLEPDVLDALRELHSTGVKDVVLSPIGFVCDHMEVVYDLDVEARDLAAELGVGLTRAKTAGVHPRFVEMAAELVESPEHAFCQPGCCPAPVRRRPGGKVDPAPRGA